MKEEFLVIHSIFNQCWRILRDRYQWCNPLQALWQRNIEPKKATLAWLIAFRAIWTNQKALKINNGNGLCTRCNLEEDDIHIFFRCAKIAPTIKRLQ